MKIFNWNKCLEKKYLIFFMFIIKCFDINKIIKNVFKKMYIYIFECFLYLYKIIIGESVDYYRDFLVILIKGKINIFKY